MKNVKRVSSRLLLFAASLLMTAGLVTLTHQDAFAGGGVEDTWYADLGDCAGAPSDCLDTICVGSGCNEQ